MPERPKGRNDPCPCGSGLKYKKCCGLSHQAPQAQAPVGSLRVPVSPFPLAGTPIAVPDPVSSNDAAKAVATAIKLRNAGRLSDSIAFLRRAAGFAPGNARIHLDLGTTLLACNLPRDAVQSLAQAIMLDPDLGLAHFHLGAALQALGRDTEAMAQYERAVALAPRLAEAHRRLGALQQGWRLSRDAAISFRAAAATADTRAEALLDTAKALRVEGDFDSAEKTLRRALALNPRNLEASELLASMAIEKGDFGEGEKLLRNVIARDPGRPLAMLELLSVVKAGDGDRPLLADAMKRAALPNTLPNERMMLEFALGRGFEQLGDFAEAIVHFDAANEIRASLAPLDRSAMQRQTDELIETISSEILHDRTRTSSVVDERPIFILGLPRSGTTLVEQIISSHPLVGAAGELGFWPEKGPALLASHADAAMLSSAAGHYLDGLDALAPGKTRVTDKNPFNFNWAGLIRCALPQARIIHVRRSPIDTVLSIYTNYFSSRRTFFVGNREDLMFWYADYLRLMSHWRSVLPPDRFIELDYEQLVRDREQQTRMLISFCGLDWSPACLSPERNSRRLTTASIWQARQGVYASSIGRWQNYADHLGSFRQLVAPDD